MLSELKSKWSEYGFEITLGLCLAFLLLFGLYHKIKGKRGTWTSKKDYFLSHQSILTPQNKTGRQPPRESRGETECRRVLQLLFNRRFDKARPDFLRNPVTGGDFNLELDCFDPELRIAVEYNGVQHYRFIPFFHKNKEAFLNQKYRDDMKRRICKENGILLIEVPYTIKIEDIKKFIQDTLTVNGIIP
jgi:hypothetical protein|uniref:Uncharacterized protein n=1 Tax=viral metagenome TaxID=1070528 RepID=A0A6C0H3T4_9ZZZZ